MKHLPIFIFLALFFTHCSEKREQPTDLLKDHFYKYLDLKNTVGVSAETGAYKQLDSLGKRQVIPDITKGLSMDPEFPYSSMFTAYLVAKQKKIGSIQPIVLKFFADDFNALALVNLNEKNEPVSFLIIDSEEFCGSDHDTYCEKFTHSRLNGKEIITYNLFKVESSNNDEMHYTDSIAYRSLIQPDGKIETVRMDSVRLF